MMQVFSVRANTHAAVYDAVLQRDWANAQVRNYHSTLELYLDRDNVPPEVFENLIATVKKGAAAIQRYYRFKKEKLGIEEYHMYDRFIPILDVDVAYKYDDIPEWIVGSVEPLGAAYQQKVREGFANGWIDVYENEGKSSGGFCSGVYGVHPYILVNYNETVGEMFTVAHEMGHALHGVLAEESQPYATAGSSIFVAEVASISNELLLLDYLLNNTDDPRERAFLLQHALESQRGTFYRQLLFADFEWRAHQMVEQGLPVTSQSLYDLYMDVVDDFYGDGMVRDSLLGYYWSGVPHFHFGPYYVYKYATSYAAASHLVSGILQAEGAQRQEAAERLLNLLRSGDSDYPMELLKQAGVDMSDIQTYQAVVDLTVDLVDRLMAALTEL
jgi:oligoendopeptidase F